jgi:hypothetical protein
VVLASSRAKILSGKELQFSYSLLTHAINSILHECDHVIFNIAGMAVRSINAKNPQKQLPISTNIECTRLE